MYNLRQMLKKVDKDAITNIENIKKIINSSKSKLICKVLNVSTFSVEIIATRLAIEFASFIFCIGFKYKDKIQFELRTNNNNNYNLIILLKLQRKFFKPITSGGHPKAAGALINVRGKSKFCESLSKSLVLYEGGESNDYNG